MLYKILFILSLFLGIACTSAKKTINSAPDAQQPMVLTVILKILPTENDQLAEIEKINVIKAAGHVKASDDRNANYEFRFIDAEGRRIDSRFKALHLTKVIEYVNEDGQLAKKTIKGQPEIVSIRTNYSPEMRKLVVYQLIKENYEPIGSFPLAQK